MWLFILPALLKRAVGPGLGELTVDREDETPAPEKASGAVRGGTRGKDSHSEGQGTSGGGGPEKRVWT